MEKLRRFDSSAAVRRAIYLLLFLFALALNLLTPYAADDYVYRISFYDKEPVGSLLDVFRSMYVHSYRMNGRVVSHFFGQAFMLLPKPVFGAVNAAMLVLLVHLVSRTALRGRGNIGLLLGAMALWQFLPVFGQVALWQMGSVNYLWGMVFGLMFLQPYLDRYRGGEREPGMAFKIGFSVFAFVFGSYIEGMSFISIFLAGLLIVAARLLEGRKLRTWLLIPLLAACAGYVCLMLMPAEVAAKCGQVSTSAVIDRFNAATVMLRTYGSVLLCVWAAAMILALRERVASRTLILSVIFTIGALAANYMLVAAAYYEARCASPVVLFLILAIGALLPELEGKASGWTAAAGAAVLTVVFCFSLVTGVHGVWTSWTAYRGREITVQEALDRGERDLELAVIHPENPYSPFWGLIDLNTETCDTWPNTQMSQFFGVDSIIGY